jgi:hypothetical protein
MSHPKSNIIHTSLDRTRLAAGLRELANVFRFTPGLVADRLGENWVVPDLFERDVELAWFLVRHAGDAKDAFDDSTREEITYRVLKLSVTLYLLPTYLNQNF